MIAVDWCGNDGGIKCSGSHFLVQLVQKLTQKLLEAPKGRESRLRVIMSEFSTIIYNFLVIFTSSLSSSSSSSSASWKNGDHILESVRKKRKTKRLLI